MLNLSSICTQNTTKSASAGYETCTTRSKEVALERGQVHYALLPVWVLNTQWKGQNFLFTINGQSGRVAGKLPLDRRKYWTWFAGTAAAISAAITALLLLI